MNNHNRKNNLFKDFKESENEDQSLFSANKTILKENNKEAQQAKQEKENHS